MNKLKLLFLLFVFSSTACSTGPVSSDSKAQKLIAVKDYEDVAFYLYREKYINDYKLLIDKYFTDINEKLMDTEACKHPEPEAKEICNKLRASLDSFMNKTKLIDNRKKESKKIKPTYQTIDGCTSEARALEDRFSHTKDEQEFIQSYIITYEDCLILYESSHKENPQKMLTTQSAVTKQTETQPIKPSETMVSTQYQAIQNTSSDTVQKESGQDRNIHKERRTDNKYEPAPLSNYPQKKKSENLRSAAPLRAIEKKPSQKKQQKLDIFEEAKKRVTYVKHLGNTYKRILDDQKKSNNNTKKRRK